MPVNMKLSITSLARIFLFLLLILIHCLSARSEPNQAKTTKPTSKSDDFAGSPDGSGDSNPEEGFGGGGYGGGDYGGGYGYYPGAPPGGYGIPGSTGGGYGGFYFPRVPPGGRYGIPGSGGGFNFPGDPAGAGRPSMVCMEWGPCRLKRLRCPNKCFRSFHRQGKGYAYGGAGGGCTFDCTKCLAYC